MALEFKDSDLENMTITQRQKLLEDLQKERKIRMKKYIRPAIEQYIKPINDKHIKPLKDKHIKTLNAIIKMTKKKIPDKQYIIDNCVHCGKKSNLMCKKTAYGHIKEVE